MNVTPRERWESFVEETLRAGRYGSAGEVVCEGLRLLQQQEPKLQALRKPLAASINAGAESTDPRIDAALEGAVAGCGVGPSLIGVPDYTNTSTRISAAWTFAAGALPMTFAGSGTISSAAGDVPNVFAGP